MYYKPDDLSGTQIVYFVQVRYCMCTWTAILLCTVLYFGFICGARIAFSENRIKLL